MLERQFVKWTEDIYKIIRFRIDKLIFFQYVNESGLIKPFARENPPLLNHVVFAYRSPDEYLSLPEND